LWAFNDERVVRAVVASAIPVISGVGHETDFTLTDFAADLRAPTPTAAAELATPVTLFDLASAMSTLGQRMGQAVVTIIETGRIELSNIESRLRFNSPARKLQSERQRVDELSRRGLSAQAHRLALEASRLEGLGKRLVALNPFEVLARGYAVVTRQADGSLIRSVGQVNAGEEINVRVSDGQFDARIEYKKHPLP
jgi:exodeoxyribonuclease VII large subunit